MYTYSLTSYINEYLQQSCYLLSTSADESSPVFRKRNAENTLTGSESAVSGQSSFTEGKERQVALRPMTGALWLEINVRWLASLSYPNNN